MPSLARTLARALVLAALVTTVAAVPAKSTNGEAIVKAMHHPTKEAACEMCKDSGRGAACYAGDCGDGSASEQALLPP